MGGFSIAHWMIFLVIILIFAGPSRLPGLGKSLGEAIRGFKKGLEGDEIDVTNQARQQNLQAGQQPSATQATNTAANQTTNQATNQSGKDEPKS